VIAFFELRIAMMKTNQEKTEAILETDHEPKEN
jgi:hypothetical protein